MKTRPEWCFSGAVSKIVDSLGIQPCADTLGRSASLLRKWCYPDIRSYPTIGQSLKLDSA